MQEVFNNLSLPDRITNAIRLGVESYLKNYTDISATKIKDAQRAIRGLETQIESLEQKYIRNEFEYEAYFKWKTKLNAELSDARGHLAKISQAPTQQYDIDSLIHMGGIYGNASTPHKQALVGAVFNNRLYYSDGIWRTPYLLNLFTPKAALLQEKRLLVIEEPLSDFGKTPTCTPDGTSVEPFLSFFRLLHEIKNAA